MWRGDEVPVLRLKGHMFDPQPVHTKDYTTAMNNTYFLLSYIQFFAGYITQIFLFR